MDNARKKIGAGNDRLADLPPIQLGPIASTLGRAAIVSVILTMLPGCVVVGGYSSERGWFIWPGTFVILAVVVLVLLLRRRR